MTPQTPKALPTDRLCYFLVVCRGFLSILLILGLTACGGDEPDSQINSGSGLSVDSTSLNLTLDRDGSLTSGDVSVSWDNPIVTQVEIAMPPGTNQPSWIDFSIIGNSSPANVSIGLSSSSFPLGMYSTTVRITAFNGNTPMEYSDVSVVIEVVERPDASPPSLTFDMVEGILPVPQSIRLSRTDAIVTISNATIIAFDKEADSAINGESVEVTMNSTTQTLPPGIYLSSLEIDYNGGHWSIPITLNVLDAQNKFAVAMMVNPDTPLSGELHVNTGSTMTRISLDISDGVNSWTIDFNTLSTDHYLPVVGFRPNRTHTIIIRAVNNLGEPVLIGEVLPVTTPALPVGFPKLTVSSAPTMMESGFTLFNVIPQNPADPFGAALIIVDNVGEVVWYHQGSDFFDVRQLSNGNILFMQGFKIVEMDKLGNRLNEWSNITDATTGLRVTNANRFHHEIYPMNNGNFLTLSVEARQYVNYPTSENPTTSTTETATVAGDVIVEFDNNGELVNRWYLLDMLDPYRIGYGSISSRYWDGAFGAQTRDWSHANAVVNHVGDDGISDTDDDYIIVSVRHQDAMVKFNKKTGNVVWILAPDEGNWATAQRNKLLTPTNPQIDFFTYHQHAPMILANGNILVYDNGDYRTNPSVNFTANHKTFSRAVEYSINEATMEVTLVWEYGEKSESQPGWNYSGALGDADLLTDSGNVLITHGNLFDGSNRHWARIVEVTHTVGNASVETEVFEMKVEASSSALNNGFRVYRSERIKNL